MTTSHERVLCFPKSLLDDIAGFQGFREDDGALVTRILKSGKAAFIERGIAEQDPSFKQLIPYVAMRWKDKFLYYVRGKESGEARLRFLGSLGIGGHIAVSDRSLFAVDMMEVFREGLIREVAEEVVVETKYDEKVAGLINDDSNPVGKVHLGVLVVWNLAEPRIRKRERAITSLEFLTGAELKSKREGMETWSRIVLDNAALFANRSEASRQDQR